MNTFISLRDRVAIRRWRRKVHDEFDCLCAEYGVMKVPTKRSSYIVMSNLQSFSYLAQTIQITRFAIACQEKLHSLVPLTKRDSNDNILSSMRFGLHVGASLTMLDNMRNDATNQQSFVQVLDRATMMQKYVQIQSTVWFFSDLAITFLTRSPPSLFDRTSLPGQIHTSKSVAKHFKSIGIETCLDRRTDGRLVIATYWLVSRCHDDVCSRAV
jgi:hypothetical protein